MAKELSTKQRNTLVEAICERIASSSVSLTKTCEEKGITVQCFHKWLIKYPKLVETYENAQRMRADYLADEMIEIADTCREGKIVKDTPKGREVETGDMVERAKLQIDARKWAASKLAPRKYGDHIDIDQRVIQVGIKLEEQYINTLPQIKIMPAKPALNEPANSPTEF